MTSIQAANRSPSSSPPPAGPAATDANQPLAPAVASSTGPQGQSEGSNKATGASGPGKLGEQLANADAYTSADDSPSARPQTRPAGTSPPKLEKDEFLKQKNKPGGPSSGVGHVPGPPVGEGPMALQDDQAPDRSTWILPDKHPAASNEAYERVAKLVKSGQTPTTGDKTRLSESDSTAGKPHHPDPPLADLHADQESLPKTPTPLSATKVESPAPAANTVVRKTEPHIDPDPSRFGFSPKDPRASVRPGEHALNIVPKTGSQHVSASANTKGAPNINGKPHWIDVDKTTASGKTKFHSEKAVAEDVQKVVQEGIAKPAQAQKWNAAQARGEREVLLEGHVPADAVETGAMRALKRGARVVKLAAIGVTVYDVARAVQQSFQEGSLKPLAAEAIRQAGGWGSAAGAYLGAAAIANAAGLAGFAALGPAIAASTVVGIAGYLASDWVADHIHRD